MATVHMICGRVGAGKTTYARELCVENRLVFFSLDDWMASLFLEDAPQPMSLAWALERTARCEAQIWKLCQALLAIDIDVVLELGFFTRAQRDRFRQLVQEAGASMAVHHVTASRETRLERVRARNAGSATLTVEVDDAMFEWAEGYFEPLQEDELDGARVVDTGA